MPAIPLTYVQIADDLTARIEAGEYPPGERIPSYRQLGEMYSVHWTTAAKSVSLLRDRGLVVGAPGRGVYVAELR